jgi:membrane-associated phospholipid phosphatase
MRIALVLTLMLTLLTGPVAADEAPEPSGNSPFHVDLAADLPLTIGGAVVSVVPELFKGELPGPSCPGVCDPGRLNALDRTVVGNNSHVAAVISDAFVGTSVALPLGLDLIDALVHKNGDRMAGYGKDVLVLAEVLSMDYLLNSVVKFAVRRPRPFTYDASVDPAEREQNDAALSFYSAHSSISFAMATSYSYLFTLRHPRSPGLVVPVWIGTHLLASATAVLRVEAGKHFWTDVITGALAGSSVGLLVSYLHHRLGTRPPGGYAVRLSPMPLPGGLGISLLLAETR